MKDSMEVSHPGLKHLLSEAWDPGNAVAATSSAVFLAMLHASLATLVHAEGSGKNRYLPPHIHDTPSLPATAHVGRTHSLSLSLSLTLTSPAPTVIAFNTHSSFILL